MSKLLCTYDGKPSLRSFAVLAFYLFSSATLWAENSELKSLETRDSGRSWAAVGRLTLDDEQGFCTASLIAPDVILTVAHCLYDDQTGQKYPLDIFEFQAGWRHGRAEAYRRIKSALTHPKYKFNSTKDIEKISQDIAMVLLDHPIQNSSIDPFVVAPLPKQGEDVAVVSYARGRKNAPSIQSTCKVAARQEGILVMTCDVDYGASGSPVFKITPQGVAIVSVISAMANMQEQKVSLGVSLEKALVDLTYLAQKSGMLALDPENTLQRRQIGAKFAKP